MAEYGQQFTVEEVMSQLDEDFDIPNDGIDSEIELDDSEEDEDECFDNFGDQGTNIRLSELEIVETEDPKPPRKRGRRSVTNNFSEIEWSKNVDAFTNYKFEENTGPSTVMSAEKVAVDFFLLLVTNRMLTEIVNETNRYARQSLQAQGKNPSDWDKKQVTLVEMKAWLGLIMAMSIHKLPAIVDYWKDDWILGVPAFSSIMSRNRFQEILRYLHLNNNETMPQRDQDNYDKLYKVRPFIESLKTNFQIQYHPHCEQSIDEAMVKYKGRTVLKQYMPMKPIKRGMKMWCRADSHSGYLCDFNVYCGKDKGGVENGLGYAVVTDLCRSIYGKYHKIYFDNFFTSLDLIEDLYSNKTLSCGTVRAGRKNFPKELFNKETTKNMAIEVTWIGVQKAQHLLLRGWTKNLYMWLGLLVVHPMRTFQL